MAKESQKSLAHRVLQGIGRQGLIEDGDTVIAAVSGGPDSMCLADILQDIQKKRKFNLAVCHFNHRLREESDREEQFVKNFFSGRGIEVILGRAPKKGLYKNEEAARDARYGFFEKILKKRRGAKIALAHTANDFAETLIFRLVRGSGLRGLSAIPVRRGQYVRPLLHIKRDDVLAYNKNRSIPFCLDPSNQDLRYSRNYIRNKVIPLLLTLNPSVVETLVASGEAVADDYDLIATLASAELTKLTVAQKTDRIELDYDGWLLLCPSLQRMVIRHAIDKMACLMEVSVTQIQQVIDVLKKGVGKKQKLLPHSLRITLMDGKIIVEKLKN